MEILYNYDLGDEIGRGNLQKLLAHLLKECNIDEKNIEMIMRCAENLMTDQNVRLQYFVEIVQDICGLNTNQNDLLNDRNLINELLANSADADLNLKLSSLKVKILDLEEQESEYVSRKDYVKAHQITEEKTIASEEYMNLLRPLLEQHSNQNTALAPLVLGKVVKNENILKALQIIYHMVVSPKVRSLNPTVSKLHNDFICRHFASNQIAIRDWALKCGSAFSMLYESLAKDVFDELYLQFFKNHNIRIWETSITCIFDLLDKYGVDNFVVQEQQSKSKKSGRQLYNTLEFVDGDDDATVASAGQGVGVIHLMSHFLDTCDDVCIMRALINGFSRLVIRGYIEKNDIMEKLLLLYFNPATENEINQLLGAFLECLIRFKKHSLIEPCLLPTIMTVISAPYENPLHEIPPETISRFIIDATRSESSSDAPGGLIHNKIAKNFINEMICNVSNKDLCKLLAKELVTLEVNYMQIPEIKAEIKEMVQKLIKSDFDPKTIRNVITFNEMMDGVFDRAAKPIDNDSDEEEEDTIATDVNQKEKRLNDIAENDETASNTLTPAADNDDAEKSTENESTVVEKTAKTEPKVVEKQPSATSARQRRKRSTSRAKSPAPAPPPTPTTYGANNTIGQQYLRKSMMCLTVATGETDTESENAAGGDGPSRPAKIRIEARIDSDEKSKEKAKQTQEKRRATPLTGRAKRNLNKQPSTESDSNETSHRPTRGTRNRPAAAQSTPAKNKTLTPRTPPDTPGITPAVSVSTFGSKTPDPINSRRSLQEELNELSSAQALTTSKAATSIGATDNVATDDDNEELIPPSPTENSRAANTSRFRRNAVMNNSRATRNQLATVPSSPNQTDTAINPSLSLQAMRVLSSTVFTPLRKGRKRGLTLYPKATDESDSSNGSPLRKHYRTESGGNATADKEPTSTLRRSLHARNQTKKSLQTEKSLLYSKLSSTENDTESGSDNPANFQKTPKTTMDISANNDSASSSKENSKLLSNSLALDVYDNSAIVVSDGDVDADEEMSSQAELATVATRPSKRKSLRENSPRVSGNVGGAVLTRSAQRRDRLNKSIVTRKRLSLEHKNLKDALKPGLSSKSYSRLQSKIPVRKFHSKPFENARDSVAAASGSTSSEEAAATTSSKIPRRQQTNSKITSDSSLARNKSNQPMVRAGRVASSSTSVSSNSIGLRRKRAFNK